MRHTGTSLHSNLLFSSVDEKRKALGEYGAVEAIVDAMKVHPDNADVCANGCCALGLMASGNGKCHHIHRTSMSDYLRNLTQKRTFRRQPCDSQEVRSH